VVTFLSLSTLRILRALGAGSAVTIGLGKINLGTWLVAKAVDPEDRLICLADSWILVAVAQEWLIQSNRVTEKL